MCLARVARVLSVAAVAGLIALSGCSDNGAFVAPSGGGTSASDIYVINASTNAVQEYSLTSGSSSTATPVASITLPSGFSGSSLAADSSGNLYVGGYNNTATEILVYAPGSSGAATPTHTLVGNLITASNGPSFAAPLSMQINSSGTLGMLTSTVSGYQIVTIANVASANGSITPTTLVTGGTGIASGIQPYSVTIDASGKVYVAGSVSPSSASSTIYVYTFAAGATGNVAPASSFTVSGFSPYGVAVDGSGNVYLGVNTSAGTNGQIQVFAAGSSGAATPTRTIAGTSTGLPLIGGMRVDTAGNIFAIVNSGSTFPLLGFSSTASGNTAPTVSLLSSTLTSPQPSIAIH